ncbi:5-methylcytosine-specific restriction enzyme subunit McrC [Dehalococcoides mccartyi]|uniref:5-methylcytosine-specific restriction enzyme subunit McrC n=1 Tax=Dehalococcoides mccartyi TaxID=61435 RepID=A0AB33HYL7_9CHLR|nr:5-methylcytosine-specific restriction enzyme subunit McrC [Dehalococcoides mccartyi]
MIPIRNVYYMLSYAFQVLNEQGYKNIATEQFDNTAELCAAILTKGIAFLLKRGLGKEYIPQVETLSTLRGKVEVTDSVKGRTMLKKQLVCSYDDFSINSYMNRIIKTTAELLLHADISKTRKKELRKLMVYFKDVDELDVHTINWHIQYNRNNQTYRMLISICWLLVKGLLQTNSDGSTRLMDFLDEQRMCRLYEKFILEYYKREFPLLNASASQIPWALDDGIGDMLPAMQSDITLSNGNDVLIIDAKYYPASGNTQVQYDKHTLHSGNLYQIFTYVKNKDAEFGETPHKVSAMLLYAKTEEDIQPDNSYRMSGNEISVKTLDLNMEFAAIAEQLNTIVKERFGLVAT